MIAKWEKASGLSVAREEGRLQTVSLRAVGSEELQIVWLGHACFLLRWQGVTLLVDPVFRKWMGGVSRLLPLPRLEEIGRVDAVLITHGHMDHLDEKSIRKTGTERILIPSKTAGFLSRGLRARCDRLELGDQRSIGHLQVQVEPAVHGGWRYPWQRGYVACSFTVSDGERVVYAAGDSAYGPHFEEIGRRFKIDSALLPIGAFSPQRFLQKLHLNPEEACQAAMDLGTDEVIPFHFGTYRLSLEPHHEPLTRFAVEAARCGLDWRVPLGLE